MANFEKRNSCYTPPASHASTSDVKVLPEQPGRIAFGVHAPSANSADVFISFGTAAATAANSIPIPKGQSIVIVASGGGAIFDGEVHLICTSTDRAVVWSF